MISEPNQDDTHGPPALRLAADHVALEDHASTSARPAHRIIATHLWAMLRRLGFTDGQVLAVGDDAATLIGLPHTDGTSFLSLVARITAAHSPGSQVSVQLRVPRAHDRFDVVIASLPYNDVRLQDPQHVLVRRVAQAELALTMHTLTRPGGYTVLLASHDLMDHPFPETRRHLHLGADLLGAVRLPAGTHRHLPGLDLTTDLLVLQRRLDGAATRSQDFEHTTTIHVDDRDVAINTYFDNHPDHVLGTIGADPLAWGPAAVTVASTPDRLDRDLADALATVTAHSLRTGLTYSSDTSRPERQEASATDPARLRERPPGSSIPRTHHRREHGQPGINR